MGSLSARKHASSGRRRQVRLGQLRAATGRSCRCRKRACYSYCPADSRAARPVRTSCRYCQNNPARFGRRLRDNIPHCHGRTVRICFQCNRDRSRRKSYWHSIAPRVRRRSTRCRCCTRTPSSRACSYCTRPPGPRTPHQGQRRSARRRRCRPPHHPTQVRQGRRQRHHCRHLPLRSHPLRRRLGCGNARLFHSIAPTGREHRPSRAVRLHPSRNCSGPRQRGRTDQQG
jgi:hypothetical protein